jgi:hypothetical protein
VATVGGILFAMNWAAALIACAVWVVVFIPFRYVSLGSVIAALSLPLAQHFTWNLVKYRWGGETPWVVTVFLGIAGLLVIWRHKANLKRLFEGTEKRFGPSRHEEDRHPGRRGVGHGAGAGAGAGGTRRRALEQVPDYAAQMRERRENVKFLPGVPLGPSVEVVSGAPPAGDVYIAAVPDAVHPPDVPGAGPVAPEAGARRVRRQGARAVDREAALGDPARGAEDGADRGAQRTEPRAEVARGLPASIVAAGEGRAAKAVQALFIGSSVRVYTSGDMLGVELGGALKNVIALGRASPTASGWATTPRRRSSRGASWRWRGSASAMGAKRQTFFGLRGSAT